MDWFLILTPILLLAVISLLGFVGCGFSTRSTYYSQEMVVLGDPAMTTISAELTDLVGGEFVVATLQWPQTEVRPPQLGPMMFSTISGADSPVLWNGPNIQTFWATNMAVGDLTVTATLRDPAGRAWSLCVTAYPVGKANATYYSPVTSDPSFKGTDPAAAAIVAAKDDFIYAVAFGADPDGTFPGQSSFTAAEGFLADYSQVTNPLVETRSLDAKGSVTATAHNTRSDGSPWDPASPPYGWIFAMGINPGFD